MDWMEVSDQRKLEQAYLGGGEAQPEPLITKIGVGGAQSLTALLQSIGQGLVTPEQAVVILVSIFGMNQEDAERIASGAPIKEKEASATNAEGASQPEEPVGEAPAIKEPTPVDPEKDPNAGPDSELAAKPVEAFTMRDDADYKLSSKELDMVASAVGFDLKKKRRKN
jgi:hypothetical protein